MEKAFININSFESYMMGALNVLHMEQFTEIFNSVEFQSLIGKFEYSVQVLELTQRNMMYLLVLIFIAMIFNMIRVMR